MKVSFSATVKAINPTDSSNFVNGVNAVSLYAVRDDPTQRSATLDISLFSHEETKELGALYGQHGAVLVTFQAGADAEEEFDRIALVSELEHTRSLLAVACKERKDAIESYNSLMLRAHEPQAYKNMRECNDSHEGPGTPVVNERKATAAFLRALGLRSEASTIESGGHVRLECRKCKGAISFGDLCIECARECAP